jgi:hypothetical protein
MDLHFLWFYSLFSVWVVGWLYGFSSLFTGARRLEFRRLYPKEGLDMLLEVRLLGASVQAHVGNLGLEIEG